MPRVMPVGGHQAALLAICLFAALLVPACASAPKMPPPAPPAVEVAIPILTPCEVEQVELSKLETEKAPVPHDIYDAVKMILADRSILKGDREALTAANNEPCGA